MALTKATEQEYFVRNKVQNYLGRWDDFKQRRLQLIDKYVFLRKKQEISKLYINLITCIVGLKDFRQTFDKEAARVRARDRLKYVLNRALFYYRRRINRLGPYEAREINNIRNACMF